MPNRTTLFFGITTLALLAFAVVKTKQAPEVCVNFRSNPKLMVGLDNYISIVVNQNKPLTAEQVRIEYLAYGDEKRDDIKATIRKEGNGFMVFVSEEGQYRLTIETKNGVVTKEFHAFAPTPIVRLGKHRNTTLKNGEFKAQGGLLAWMDCCDIDVRCEIESFDMLRITAQDQMYRVSNKGGKFSEESLSLTSTARPGDFFLFRKIMYRCPGYKEARQDEDFSIEIE